MTHQPVGTKCYCGQRGWMPGVEHVPVTWARPAWVTSREGSMEAAVIIDHVMQGWLTTMVNYALDLGSEKRRVTPHFNIGRLAQADGLARIVQIESIFTPGIHATAVSSPTAARIKPRLSSPYGASLYSIGIEHEGFSVPIPGLTDVAHTAKASLWSPSNPWPEAMVQASIRVKRWCFAQVPSLNAPTRNAIIGHYETGDPNRVNDPCHITDRSVWPVDRMIRELRDESASVPAPAPQSPASTPAPTPPTGKTYTVRSGDVLSLIAQRNGVTVAQLQQWNGIANPNRIEVGQVIRLEAPVPVTPPAPEPPNPAPPKPSPADITEVAKLLEMVRSDQVLIRNTADASAQRLAAALTRLKQD